jgi:hypothetical protein
MQQPSKYDPKLPRVGVTGVVHDSAAEAKASFRLYQHGWHPCTERFPQTFVDSEGTEYRACPDFYHPATGFYGEFKAHKLNGKGTKARADAAMARVEADIVSGYVNASARPYKAREHAWNHSIQTVACKTKQLPSHTPLVLIYEKAPADDNDAENEEKRCARNGVFMLTLDNLHTFNGFLLLASLGLDVQYTKRERRFGVELTKETTQ